MDPKKRFITQITKEDLRDIAAATNPTPGFMFRVDKSPGKLKLGLEENMLKIGIYAFLKHLGVPVGNFTQEQICEMTMALDN